MSIKLLVDGDVLCYQSAFHAQANGGTEEEAQDKIDTTLKWSLHRTKATSHQVYLTGSNNFRYQIQKTYKAHRTAPKPSLLPFCRDYLQFSWDAIVSDGEEADDLIAIEAARMGYEGCIIASIDKDFLQVPVSMYNWRKDELIDVTEEEGLKFFYKQILMGDSADNIRGVPGIGPKGADKLLDGLWDEQAMYGVCLEAYENAQLGKSVLVENARLLWLRRYEGEMWEPPE